jgi:peptidoglycan L-alanyl-D-glutamate endopeptidase CwlK
MDQITLQRINQTHPKVKPIMLDCYEKQCKALNGRAIPRYAYVLRTFKEQNDLYALGRTVKNPDGFNATKKPLGNIVTWAKGGWSFHNYGLAFDLVLIIDSKVASWDMATDFDKDGIADWFECVNIAKACGFTWGGNWARPKTDNPHFQMDFGFSIEQLYTKNVQKDYILGTTFIKL